MTDCYHELPLEENGVPAFVEQCDGGFVRIEGATHAEVSEAINLEEAAIAYHSSRRRAFQGFLARYPIVVERKAPPDGMLHVHEEQRRYDDV